MLDELAALIDAVTIHSPQAIFFAGRPVDLGPPAWPAVLPPLPPTLAGLHFRLYQEGYCARFQGAAAPAPPLAPPDPAFQQALAAANPGRTRLDPGWQVVGPGPEGHVWLQKEGRTRTAGPGAFLVYAGPDQPLRPGHPAGLYWPHESWTLQPGVYFAFGAAVGDSIADTPTMRFYWHVRAAGAPRLLAILAAALNRFQVPFRFKCPAHPAYYTRRDAAVIYVSRRDYLLVAHLVGRAYAALSADLVDDTPLFTRPLAPGLALAEDPATLESFGQQRCRLLAEALWHAHAHGVAPGAPRVQFVRDHFAAAGIDPDRPHLNPGTTEDYLWPPELS